MIVTCHTCQPHNSGRRWSRLQKMKTHIDLLKVEHQQINADQYTIMEWQVWIKVDLSHAWISWPAWPHRLGIEPTASSDWLQTHLRCRQALDFDFHLYFLFLIYMYSSFIAGVKLTICVFHFWNFSGFYFLFMSFLLSINDLP